MTEKDVTLKDVTEADVAERASGLESRDVTARAHGGRRERGEAKDSDRGGCVRSGRLAL